MNKKYITIENSGEVDINAFRLMGASSKREQNKIGFFGSGSKYGIAVLLRNNINFQIYSGLKEIKITTQKTKFREQNFDVIKINGSLTSITTDMGTDWKLWYALRELYCNALDEGSAKIDVSDTIKPRKGKTIFFIDFDKKFNDIFANWKDYFSDKRQDKLYSDKDIKIFDSTGNVLIYRKGIQVYIENTRSLFHYDMDHIIINESRVVQDTFEVKWSIINYLKNRATKDIVEKIYNNFKDTFEGTFSWDYGSENFNNNWLEALNNRDIIMYDFAGYFADQIDDKTIILPNSLARELKRCFGDKVNVLGIHNTKDRIVININDRQKKMIKDCKDFLNNANDISIEYPIKVAQLHRQILGEADLDDKIIFLSPIAFEDGLKKLLHVIIEEYMHLDSAYSDKTRDFQDYIINQYIGILEKKTNIYL